MKEKSRKAYQKSWREFRELAPEFNFEEGPPGEDSIINYFRHLRVEKKVASSSMWVHYSYINSVLKRKYSCKLLDMPRVTLYIKGFMVDTKKKASIIDEVALKNFMAAEMVNAFWEVRQAIVLMAFFGGLRKGECSALKLEQIIRSPVGYTITHKRSKQRDDKLFTKFVVPQEGGYADRLSIYLKKVNEQLSKFQGRVWFTGTQSSHFKKQAMGINMLAKVPHELRMLLKLPEENHYSFHSFRRTSATSAADAGSTTEQLVDFFGWKNASMCQEYISSSKPAILGMASRLGAFEALTQDPVVEVEVEMEEAQEVAQEDPLKQEMEEFIILEEDPEMYAMAGMELVSVPTVVPVSVPSNIECTIRQAIASVPNVSGNTVNFNIVCGNFNGPVSF
jgi:integrase